MGTRTRTVYLCFRPYGVHASGAEGKAVLPAVRGWPWDVLAVARPKLPHQPSRWCLAAVTEPWTSSIGLLFWELSTSDLRGGCASLNHFTAQPLNPALWAGCRCWVVMGQPALALRAGFGQDTSHFLWEGGPRRAHWLQTSHFFLISKTLQL